MTTSSPSPTRGGQETVYRHVFNLYRLESELYNSFPTLKVRVHLEVTKL